MHGGDAMDELVRVETHGSLALVALNRPEKRNALNPEMLRQLYQRLAQLSQDQAIHVIILYGEGAGFCAGADVALLEQARKEN
ncbi:MAG: enoyl-CoA hydratase/isomerase family protein, partial [Thermoanaerobaculum sp.]